MSRACSSSFPANLARVQEPRVEFKARVTSLMCSLGDKGRALFALAHDDYDASLTPRNDARTSASGVILWRKDKLVLDGGFKWMTCIWRFEGNALVLVPHDGSGAPGRVFVTRETQFTAPKRKRYPVQFGAEQVHQSQLLETVTYGATGYARSPLDPLASVGTTETRAVAKVASLDVGELEKLLLCVQAVREGRPAGHYLS